MLFHIWSIATRFVWAGALLLWPAVVMQPFEVYSHLAKMYPLSTDKRCAYDFYYHLNLPSQAAKNKLLQFDQSKNSSDVQIPYFAVRGINEAMTNMNAGVVANYSDAIFLAYDRVEKVGDPIDYTRIERSMANFENVAFVHADFVMAQQKKVAEPTARILTQADKDLEIIKFDANNVIAKTAFFEPKFLVRTVSYYSQWKAFIDGQPAPLLQTNIAVQGLWVPAGEHVVHWRFGAPWRYALAYFFVVLYIGVGGYLGWLWFRSKISARV